MKKKNPNNESTRRRDSPGAVHGLWPEVMDRGAGVIKIKKPSYQIVSLPRKLRGGEVTLCHGAENRPQEADTSEKGPHGHRSRSPTSYNPGEREESAANAGRQARCEQVWSFPCLWGWSA